MFLRSLSYIPNSMKYKAPTSVHCSIASHLPEEASLVVEDMLWWGQWMVRLLKTRNGQRPGRLGDAEVDVYRRYLSLPPLAYSFGDKDYVRNRPSCAPFADKTLRALL